MKVLSVFLVFAVVGLAASSSLFRYKSSSSGLSLNNLGIKAKCIGCSAGLDLLIHYLALHPEPIDTFIENKLCKLFPEELIQDTCAEFVKAYGDAIISGLMQKMSSDDICFSVGLCQDTKCRIRPKDYVYPEFSFSFDGYWKSRKEFEKPKIDPWQWLQEIIDRIADKHLPLFDGDNDGFSEVAWLRGSSWRGKDCNDNNANVYPGRKVNPDSSDADYNCNGISGTDPETNQPWKDVLCGNYSQMGVAVIGDSAGAHFSIPEAWVNVSQWSAKGFSDILIRALHELDRPHYSGYTGFVDSTDELPVRSIYKYLIERNRCNHRDFQNIAVNGGQCSNTQNNIKALSRNQTHDHPLLVFLEMIGNDVCMHLTDPAEFKQNVLKLLDYLDTTLPKGSHLVMIGLVNGSLLYDQLHNEIHPIGVNYAHLYEYLECQESNPCVNWLTSNATKRAETTAHAFKLNDQYRAIIQEGRVYKNFDYTYYDLPTMDIINKAASQGLKVKDLVEHVDGFHPGQVFHAMLGDWLWEALEKDHPEWLGDANPNNQRIVQMFGDQGGY